jgi:UPF0755 protein
MATKELQTAEHNTGENDTDTAEYDAEPSKEIVVPKRKRLSEFEKLEREERKWERKKQRRKKTWMNLFFSLLRLAIIIFVAVFISAKLINYGREFLGDTLPEEPITIDVPAGASTYEIAEILKDKGAIKTIKLFQLMSRLKDADGKFIVGKHTVYPSEGVESMLIELMYEHPRREVSVTFREGLTLMDSALLLQENGVVKDANMFIEKFNAYTGYTFETYVNENEATERSQLRFWKMEGYFYPDTYTFFDSREENVNKASGVTTYSWTKDLEDEDYKLIFDKIINNFQKRVVYTDLDTLAESKYITRAKEIGWTLDEAITLASIIQKESPNKAEMAHISSVFHNRLNNPAGIGSTQPFLQSDPTVFYARDVVRPNMPPSANREYVLAAYSTYESAGLPSGAICNPGIDAIEAALFPVESEDFYFCADDAGKTYYAKDLKGHNENLRLIGLL